MPLVEGKSDKARSENIEIERNAGKPPAQAAAIAYSVQRKNGGQDTAGADRAGDPFLQAVDALHKCAADCMAYDRKRK
jgi:hypothetical protein